MFTGLIQKTGRLVRMAPRGAGGTIAVSHGPLDEPLNHGESVAVQGVCLTVRETDRNGFIADLLKETLERSNLGQKRVGALLNLERAMRTSDRLGGHYVSGHVDGTGRLLSVARSAGDRILEIQCEAALLQDMCIKGSIACDGISLTIVGLGHATFTVHIIPSTWASTSLREARVGDRLNLETDILARYARGRAGHAEGPESSASAITMERLKTLGF